MNLAKNEHLIKTWNYATETVGNETKTVSLMVTNKRIIHLESSKMFNRTTEVKTDTVTGISSESRRTSPIFGIILTVIGVLLGVGFAFPLKTFIKANNIGGIVGAAIAIAVGIVCLVIGLMKIHSPNYFTVTLETNTPLTPIMTFGKSQGTVKAAKKATNPQIRVNPNIAIDIVETIGAVILNSQDNVEVEEDIEYATEKKVKKNKKKKSKHKNEETEVENVEVPTENDAKEDVSPEEVTDEPKDE